MSIPQGSGLLRSGSTGPGFHYLVMPMQCINNKLGLFQKCTNILQSYSICMFSLFLCKIQVAIFKITPSIWGKKYKISVIWPNENTVNRPFKRSLFTILDAAPLTV